jgi:hypothetical protein
MSLLDDKKRKVLISEEVPTEEIADTEIKSDKKLEEKITENKTEKVEKNEQPKVTKYIVEIPV